MRHKEYLNAAQELMFHKRNSNIDNIGKVQKYVVLIKFDRKMLMVTKKILRSHRNDERINVPAKSCEIGNGARSP